MTVAALHTPGRSRLLPGIFAAAIFTSATLVFTVQPIVAKMLLPLLGGSPGVWNVCLAFFQAVLLVGYGYAHLVQRFLPPRIQVGVHLLMFGAAALLLPVHVTQAFGAPSVVSPVWWLVSVLVVSIGAPFAVLSATAPLLQAWYARTMHGAPAAENPYVLYVASNLGSMLALLSYPLLVEPLLALPEQTLSWGRLYAFFGTLMMTAGAFLWRMPDIAPARPIGMGAASTDAISWRTRGLWILLAAAPSSLMMGVTTYIGSEVASAPLFWVVPLALYLLTFVIAFQARPVIHFERALLWQAVSVLTAAILMSMDSGSLLSYVLTYLVAFFFSALICHHRLAMSRPHPKHLTEFYLLISLGGVLGGMFNAFLAPIMFDTVVEFPLVLVLCCLARPWAGAELDRRAILFTLIGVAAAAALVLVPAGTQFRVVSLAFALVAALAAWLVVSRVLLFALIVGALCAQSVLSPPDKRTTVMTTRSFFGVHRVTMESEPTLGGTLHLLFHGTTIHGAQAQAPEFRCRPITYYAPGGGMAQVFSTVIGANPGANVGVVGLGSGAIATFTAPRTRMRFFEIDPEVERIARDPRHFSFLTECAKGQVDVVLGDARLTLAREPEHSYDLLQIDAFSADNVPTHLLTTQALEGYFRALKPGGLLALHISNRNLALEAPAAASAKAIGATALMREHVPQRGTPQMAAAASQVMVLSMSAEALAPFAADAGWRPARDNGVRAWTDDYANIVGAILAQWSRARATR